MFRLISIVTGGRVSGDSAARARYDTLEAARAGATTLLREDRVWNVMIVRGDVDHEFVEWCTRVL